MTLQRAQSLLRLMVAVTALAILMAPIARARAPKADAIRQFESLAVQVAAAAKASDPRTGIPLAQQALRLARQAFGNRDPRTLISLVSLAGFYKLSGRSDEAEPLFQEAEPLFREAVQASRAKLGPRQLETLGNIIAFAQFYQAFTSRTILPVSSTMQTLVSLTDTSSPAKWSMLRFSF